MASPVTEIEVPRPPAPGTRAARRRGRPAAGEASSARRRQEEPAAGGSRDQAATGTGSCSIGSPGCTGAVRAGRSTVSAMASAATISTAAIQNAAW